MAVDTAAKRFSIMNLGTQPIFPLFIPDSSIDNGDRYHLLTLYSGIELDFPVEVEDLTGGVKKIIFKDIEPVWKQKEKETDWVDVEITKERKKLKLHKPDIINIKATIDEQIKEIYTAQAVKARIKKKRRNKAMTEILLRV